MAVAECGIRKNLAKILRSKKRPRPTGRSGRGRRTNSNTFCQILALAIETGERFPLGPVHLSQRPIPTALLGRGPRKPGVQTYSFCEPCTRVASNSVTTVTHAPRPADG